LSRLTACGRPDPTYNEPLEPLFRTVAAAVSLQPARETFVLDDCHRTWVRAMAASLGARYLTCEERTRANAGNLNHALAQRDFDAVAVLGADHIPTAGLMTHTLDLFEEPASRSSRRLRAEGADMSWREA
jgi:cellulose synthase (UDP-forming)